MPRRLLVAAAAALALAACDAAPTDRPAPHALPAMEAPHYRPLQVSTGDGRAVESWSPVPGADGYVLSRTGSPDVRISSPSVTRHVWTTPVEGADLTTATVAPHRYTVTAVQGARVLHRFVHVEQCPSLIYVAARGSGQNGVGSSAFAAGLGDRGAAVLADLRHDLGRGAWQLPAIAVDYPAKQVSFGSNIFGLALFLRDYERSVSDGVDATVAVVTREAATCSASRFVLFGYSQGAQVMGSAYAALPASLRARVASVLMFADPKYRPDDPAVTYLPNRLSNEGILGERGPLPAGRTVVQSWCWNDDAVCQRPPHGMQMHGSIYDDYEVQAAQYTARLLHSS